MEMTRVFSYAELQAQVTRRARMSMGLKGIKSPDKIDLCYIALDRYRKQTNIAMTEDRLSILARAVVTDSLNRHGR